VHFACWRLGAAFVPLNWRLALPELEFILSDCNPKVLLHEAGLGESAEHLAAATRIAHRISWGGSFPGSADYESLLDARAEPVVTSADVFHDALACVMYTSGTTGHPKGVMLTHGNFVWQVWNAGVPLRFRDGMVGLTVAPLFHLAGIIGTAYPAFQYGGSVLVMRSFDPARTLDLLADPDVGITHFVGVPANYLFMSQHPSFDTAAFPTVESAQIGASPTPIALLERWAAKGIILQQSYGLTESTGPVAIQTRDGAARELGPVGCRTLDVETRIVDIDGNDVAPSGLGELWLRGPTVSPGYWNRPDANAESFTDGWLHTGDVVREDDDGALYIVDRLKDMYISGGENVYPAEVENVLYQLDAVTEAAVIGIPDERWGEVGKAVLVLKPGAMLTHDDVIAHCTTHLAKYKVPTTVEFIDALPRTASGKVLKRELRDSLTTTGN
jgi:fatty-acyl-CoA synthase